MMMLFHAHENPVACLLFCTLAPVAMWAFLGWLLLRITRSPERLKMGPALTLALLVAPTVMATANGVHRVISALQA